MRGQGADDFGEQTAGDENAAGFLSVDVHGRLSGNLVVEPGQPQGVGGGVTSRRIPASTGTAGRAGSARAVQVTASAKASRSTRNFTGASLYRPAFQSRVGRTLPGGYDKTREVVPSLWTNLCQHFRCSLGVSVEQHGGGIRAARISAAVASVPLSRPPPDAYRGCARGGSWCCGEPAVRYVDRPPFARLRAVGRGRSARPRCRGPPRIHLRRPRTYQRAAAERTGVDVRFRACPACWFSSARIRAAGWFRGGAAAST